MHMVFRYFYFVNKLEVGFFRLGYFCFWCFKLNVSKLIIKNYNLIKKKIHPPAILFLTQKIKSYKMKFN